MLLDGQLVGDLVERASDGTGIPSRDVVGQRVAVDLAAALAHPAGELVGLAKEIVRNGDGSLHTKSITAVARAYHQSGGPRNRTWRCGFGGLCGSAVLSCCGR